MGRKIGVILSYSLMVLEILSTLLFTPFLIRTLGKAEYGVYQLVVSITAYMFLLDMGIGNSVVRYIAKYKANNQLAEQQRFLGASTIYYLVIAFITILVGFVIRLFIKDIFDQGLTENELKTAHTLLTVTALNVAVMLGTSGYFNTIIGYGNFLISKGISIMQIIFRIGLSVVALLMGYGSVGIVVVNLTMTIIFRSSIVLYVALGLKLCPCIKGIDFSFLKEIFAYSSLILLQMIATMFISMSGQILIGVLLSSSAAIIAIYSIGVQINQYVQSIGSAVTGILMPGIVHLVEKGAQPSQLQNEMIKIGRIILMLLGLILTVFIINGKQFIEIWAGEGFEQSYMVSLLIITPMIFVIIMSVGTQILWAKGKHQKQTYLKLSLSIVSLIITIFLIKWNGLLGAAIGTCVAILLSDIVTMIIVFKQDISISLKGYFIGLFKGILPCLLITILVGIGVGLIGEQSVVKFLISCFIMSITYIISMLSFGMNNYEKGLAKGVITKFKILKKIKIVER